MKTKDNEVLVEDFQHVYEYPEGGYGWIVVLASFIVHVYTIGLNTIFGVYQESYISDPPFEGIYPTAAITFIGSVANCSIGLFAFPSGRLTDLFGHRLMCAIGGMIMFFSLFLASYARDYWQFFLLQGVCFGIGCAIAYFPALTVISHYFKNRLGIAVGAAVSGSGIGGLILAPLTRYLITNYGVSISLRIHAIIGGSLVIICSYFLKPRLPTLSRDSINYSKIIKDARFIRLFMTAVFASFGYFIPFFFIPVYAKYYGMSTSQGALIVGLTNGASALGRIFLGIFADRFGHVNLLWTCLTMAPISVLTIWPFAQHFPSLALFGIAYGFFIGGFISLFPTAIQKLFGQNNIATITGMVYSGFFIGNLVGAPIAAIVLDLLTTEKDGKTTIYFLPTIVVPGGMILISSMLILNIKLIVGSGTFFRKV